MYTCIATCRYMYVYVHVASYTVPFVQCILLVQEYLLRQDYLVVHRNQGIRQLPSFLALLRAHDRQQDHDLPTQRTEENSAIRGLLINWKGEPDGVNNALLINWKGESLYV